jgi:tRNA nucleotidyltransferase/poly(A) polymerase
VSLDSLIAALSEPPSPLARLREAPGLYLVGGFLRQAWWGQQARDVDLIAAGDFQAALAALEALTGARAVELNQRFASYRLATAEYVFDLSPMHEDGLAADLQRRDYTVNALAVPLSCIGPGLARTSIEAHPSAFADLDARVLRMVSRDNLAADPARLLRGYRLAAEESLAPETATRQAWRELAGSVVSAAPERLREELLRWLGTPREITTTAGWCAADGVLWVLFPPLRDTLGCAQNEYHHLDVWEHTLLALTELDRVRHDPPPPLAQWREQFAQAWNAPLTATASNGALTRLAMLLHDAGKPVTREVQADGRVSFYGHQQVGVALIAPLLDWLRCATAESDYVERLVLEHLRLGFYSDHDPVPPRLVYRYITRLGEATPLMLLHSIADCAAHKGELATGSLERHVQAAREILAHYYAADVVAAPPVLLDGHAIMRLLGLPPGPEVGRLKRALLEATAVGEVRTPEEAAALLRELHQHGTAGEQDDTGAPGASQLDLPPF